jgi:hypothetical protein
MMQPKLGPNQPIDVDKLIESRLLVQANSGAGKSWAIRRLLEQTYASVPQIVIDVEGEFHTLREKYDYVLAGQKGGDCPADVKSATLLARRLLELSVSAIVDVYELGIQRTRFVRLFLESLVNAPRELWHPLLVVIDEAHMFCPEAGQSESASAVIDLMTRGRKRGFCGVLATQRIAKLHKDAAAEANNKLIGRCGLDIDMKRAAAELGFTDREHLLSLRTLKPGEFYAFGPALCDVVTHIKVGDVHTTHPKAGQRAMAPTPPRDRVKKILAQLADLPHEAEEEAKTVGELRTKVRQLEGELRTAKKTQPEPKIKTIEKRVISDQQMKQLDMLAGKAGALADKLSSATEAFTSAAIGVRSFAEVTRAAAAAEDRKPLQVSVKNLVEDKTYHTLSTPPAKKPIRAFTNGHAEPIVDGKPLPVGEAAVLRALIQYEGGLQKRQLTVLTGYKRSTRDAYIARLRERGFVMEHRDRILATGTGRGSMPDAQPLPTGEALREFWFRELPEGERVVLEALVRAYPQAVDRTAIDEQTGYKRSTRDAYLSRLAAKELVTEPGRGLVKASETLFEVA